nr:larval cuticle protein LCP-22-like [Procambarus clarkii]
MGSAVWSTQTLQGCAAVCGPWIPHWIPHWIPVWYPELTLPLTVWSLDKTIHQGPYPDDEPQASARVWMLIFKNDGLEGVNASIRVILAAAVAAVTFAAPQYGVQQPGPTYTAPDPTYTAPDPTYTAPDPTLTTLPQASVVPEVVPIIKDEREQEDDGTFTVYVEAGNGITQVVSGAPSGPDGAVVLSGEYSYTAPDGNPVNVKFVADENGYQPQSDLLPVAPEFPHPIPQFVLDQIAFAAQEDAANAAAQEASALPAPSQTYIQPQ